MTPKEKALNAQKLLQGHANILLQLRNLGVVRTNNNPVADFAEFLFSTAFGWELTPKSTKGHDAVGPGRVRYEIKSRRLTNEKGSRQLSAIRDLKGKHFDFLAAVLFTEHFLIHRAALIPWEVVVSQSRHVNSTNSEKLILVDEIWGLSGVKDVTGPLRAFLNT